MARDTIPGHRAASYLGIIPTFLAPLGMTRPMLLAQHKVFPVRKNIPELIQAAPGAVEGKRFALALNLPSLLPGVTGWLVRVVFISRTASVALALSEGAVADLDLAGFPRLIVGECTDRDATP